MSTISQRKDAAARRGNPTCAGGFPGPCGNKPGTPWTPYWCATCDEKRKAGISKSLAGMLADLESRSGATTDARSDDQKSKGESDERG